MPLATDVGARSDATCPARTVLSAGRRLRPSADPPGGRPSLDEVQSPEAGPLLAREAASFVARLRLWSRPRWAAEHGDAGATRADVVHHLAQAFADAAGGAPVPLPRLPVDLVLPDQLAVAADDLVRSRPGERAAGDAVAHLLLHRRELLGEPVPTGLVTALGQPDERSLLDGGCATCAGSARPGR